ncbi:hypothetical protein NCCP2716_27480 [Sporosarcina sp. NCCP-2716]|nr:hypothetical protein NCCP2716_27480 [Sporosarcina sp. NCCP-2716]
MRTCIVCEKQMDDGFLHEPSGLTFCEEKCVNEKYSREDQEDMIPDELFWTKWHDEAEESRC